MNKPILISIKFSKFFFGFNCYESRILESDISLVEIEWLFSKLDVAEFSIVVVVKLPKLKWYHALIRGQSEFIPIKKIWKINIIKIN